MSAAAVSSRAFPAIPVAHPADFEDLDHPDPLEVMREAWEQAEARQRLQLKARPRFSESWN
jgi:hypothetical protein